MDYLLEAKRIRELIKTDFTLQNGALCLEKGPEGMFPHHIFPDLGDYLPFFIYFGEDHFVEEQIRIYKETLKDGTLVSEFPSFGINGFAKSYEYTDLILGLISYYEYKKDEESKALLIATAKKAEKIFNLKGRISSFYFYKYHFRLPILDTRDGTLIETFVDLSRTLSDESYLEVAKNIFNRLTRLPFYRAHGLLPTFYAPFWIRAFLFKDRRFKSAELCKNNTNTLFAFLALYKATGDEVVMSHIDRMIKAIECHAMIEGGLVKTFNPEAKATRSFLTASFAFLDFLCDLFTLRKDPQYLHLAERIADYWISLTGDTGLFPVTSDTRETFIDSETDMMVALQKLFEISGNEKYRNAASRCFEGFSLYHAKRDYPLSVSIDTGEVIDSVQRTKFIALFLKLLIAKDRIEKGDSTTSTPWLYEILKDR